MKLSIVKNLTAGLVLSLASVTASANSGFSDVTNENFAAFKDNNTGLIWMDFNETTRKVYSKGDYKGWSLATESQIKNLVATINRDNNKNSDGSYKSSFSDMAGFSQNNASWGGAYVSRAYFVAEDGKVRRFDYIDYHTAVKTKDESRIVGGGNGFKVAAGHKSPAYFTLLVKN
ncbi:hypothetical protein [Paraglaciecola sp. L3A3]|uniref:hypothetical protein n=1 Tax=Paraglaciecola sp. L3A3 TaxID=2686358 RepID=UPI00131E8850|nr:hypothetical protein [Paraglaciecola sp. L3A3]